MNIARLPRNGRTERIGAVEARRNDATTIARDVDHSSKVDDLEVAPVTAVALADRVLICGR